MSKVESKYTSIDYRIDRDLKVGQIKEAKSNAIRNDLIWILLALAMITTALMLYFQNRYSHASEYQNRYNHAKDYQTQVSSLATELENSVVEFKSLRQTIKDSNSNIDSSKTTISRAQFQDLDRVMTKFEIKIDSLKRITDKAK